MSNVVIHGLGHVGLPLAAAIEANADIRRLVVNPLLLSIVALVHRYRARLPRRSCRSLGPGRTIRTVRSWRPGWPLGGPVALRPRVTPGLLFWQERASRPFLVNEVAALALERL